MSKFIKVTPKGEKEPRYVRASLKPFYLSQGAKVEPATEEEFYSAEPAEQSTGSNKLTEMDFHVLNKQLEELKSRIDTYEEQIAEKQQTIEKLRVALAKTRKTSEKDS